jgi:hypothetical protein
MRDITSVTSLFAALLATLVAPAQAQPCCGAITPGATRLESVLDSMGVEGRWLAGYSVDWLTGEPDNSPRLKHPLTYTHCVDFVDAVAKRLGIPMHFPAERMMNASIGNQTTWLQTEGPANGWRRIRGPIEAQRAANAGEFVVAILYEGPVTGHAAVVRPSDKSDDELRQEGPQLAQAGALNSPNINTAEGFSYHPGAWTPSGDRIEYYAHQIR